MPVVILHNCVHLQEDKNYQKYQHCLGHSPIEQPVYIQTWCGRLLTSLIAIATIVFIVWEQSKQIEELQRILHYLCLKALADEIERSDNTSEDIHSD